MLNVLLFGHHLRVYSTLNDTDFNRILIYFVEFCRHDLRHTFATRQLKNGTKSKVMQTILGHSNPAMKLDLYAHALINTKEELEKLPKLF